MQRRHIQHFKRLFGLGQLLAAGPMAGPGAGDDIWRQWISPGVLGPRTP